MQDEDFDTERYDDSSSAIQDGDPNEDLYEESTYRVVYRRSSTNRQEFSRSENVEEQQDTSAESNTSSQSSDRKHEKQDWSGQELPDKPSWSWSARPEKYDQGPQEYGQRSPTVSRSEERSSYYSVAKWEVDYNNKNYIRSKLNKPGGFHRYALGRPLDWDIEYDNMYYLRSFVNDPKGMHRTKQDIKRKRVPDNDPLADNTGWDLEYGPMFNQQEGDVPYMPDERRVSRGAYRYYGVRRNASDCDRKIHEKQLDFKEINNEEFKYGPEFLQRDVQHILEQKDRLIGRGGYRHYDAIRNVHDERPADGPDYRENYATSDEISETSEYEEDIPKGKPFKHTILKKIVTLGRPASVENVRYSTHIKFIPGEGSRSFYEGESLRKKGAQGKSSGAESRTFSVGNSSRTGMQAKKNHGSSTFKTKQSNYERPKTTQKPSYQDFDRGYKQRYSHEKQSTKASDRQQSSNHLYRMRKQDDWGISDTVTSRRDHEDTDLDEDTMDENKVLKKFPPHIEERIYTLRKRLSRPEVLSSNKDKNSMQHQQSQGKSHKEGYQSDLKSQGIRMPEINIDDYIDFRKHLEHPHDHGKSVKTGYERFVNDHGSEIWVKTEESYAELHHL